MLMIQETYVNKDQDCVFGESGWYEAYTDNRQKLFLNLQKEYGRCESKMYVDLTSGGCREIGYVFLKKMQYERSDKFYLREVWVEVREVKESEEDV